MDISADIDYQIEKMVLEINSQLINSELKDSNLSNIDIQSTDHESINIIKNILENRSDLLSINLDLNTRKVDIHFTSDAIRELNKNTHQFNLSKRNFENNIKLNDQKVLEFKNKIKTLKNEIETLKRTNSDVAELYRKSQEELKDSKSQIQNTLNDANHYKDMYYSEHANNYSKSVKLDELKVQISNYELMLNSQRKEIECLKNNEIKIKDDNNDNEIIENEKNNEIEIKDDNNDNEIIENEKNNEIEIENYSTYYNNFPLMAFTGSKPNSKLRPFDNEDIILTILRNLEIRIKYNKDYNLEKLTKELNLISYKYNTIKFLYRIFNNDYNKTYNLIENLIIDYFIDKLSISNIIKKYNLYELATDTKVAQTATTTYCQASVNNTLSLLFTYIRVMYIYHLPKQLQDHYVFTFSRTYKLKNNIKT